MSLALAHGDHSHHHHESDPTHISNYAVDQDTHAKKTEHSHSHEDEHHEHSEHEHHHDCQHHNHGDHEVAAFEPNIHKRIMLQLSELTGFCCIMNSLDAVLKPLPFLAQSLLSTTFISVVPIFLIYLMNSMITERSRDKFVHILLSFALGGLLGDVFFHTLPHLMESNSSHSHADHTGHHHHSEEAMNNNLVIIFGLLVFFLIEKIIHNYFETGHSHSHKDNAAEAEH